MPGSFGARHLLLTWIFAATTLTCAAWPLRQAEATPALSIDMATGEVLYQQEATRPWFPASTTKLMTVYVALSAVRDGKISLDTPLVVSARAHMMPPSKMGFPVGTQVTLGNALKMLMVPSANDMAITVAEGVSGSVEAFAEDMNRAAAQLGLHESHFVNPNGLPDPDHYSSARDMALIARALYAQFPEEAGLYDIGRLSLGSRIIGNHNNLLGRYPGVDGMKTGFTCAAGFNIVATSFRDGRRLLVVVFGAPSVATRSSKVVALFDRGFANIDRPSGPVSAIPTMEAGPPPDMRNAVCHNRAGLIAQFEAEVNALDAPLVAQMSGAGLGLPSFASPQALLYGDPKAATPPPGPMALRINSMPQAVFEPVPVHIGAEPGYTGPVAQARAPHTPVGSEPEPATAAAYAAEPPPEPQGVKGTPIQVDANALPLKGRRAKAARARLAAKIRHRPVLRAAAEAPKTKVIADSTTKAHSAAKPVARPVPKPPLKAATKPGAAKPQAKKTTAAKPKPAGHKLRSAAD